LRDPFPLCLPHPLPPLFSEPVDIREKGLLSVQWRAYLRDPTLPMIWWSQMILCMFCFCFFLGSPPLPRQIAEEPPPFFVGGGAPLKPTFLGVQLFFSLVNFWHENQTPPLTITPYPPGGESPPPGQCFFPLGTPPTRAVTFYIWVFPRSFFRFKKSRFGWSYFFSSPLLLHWVCKTWTPLVGGVSNSIPGFFGFSIPPPVFFPRKRVGQLLPRLPFLLWGSP